MLCINKWAGQGRELATRGREPCRSPSFQFNSTCSYQVKGDKDVQLCKRACKCRFVCKVKFSNCGGLRGLGGLAGDIAQWGQGLLSGSEPDCKCPACCLISCQLLINMISASSRISREGMDPVSWPHLWQSGFLIPLLFLIKCTHSQGSRIGGEIQVSCSILLFLSLENQLKIETRISGSEMVRVRVLTSKKSFGTQGSFFLVLRIEREGVFL